MLNKVVSFILSQSALEKFMAVFFLTLLAYMVIVTFIKSWHRKRLDIFMLKNKKVLCRVTYIIIGFYFVFGCLVKQVVKNPFVYLGCMLVAGVLVNYLYILEYGIKKIKDVEFVETATDVLKEVVDNSIIHDQISDYMTGFIEFINCLDEDEVNSLSLCDYNKYWIACITEYLDERVKYIDYIEIGNDENVINNYVKEIISRENLWYKENEINKFAKTILDNEEVKLTSGSRIIPITTKRFKCLVHIIGNNTVSDYDRNFIVNTYTIMSLL